MCLAIPSKIISINTKQNTAIVDTMGVQREARLELYEQIVRDIEQEGLAQSQQN